MSDYVFWVHMILLTPWNHIINQWYLVQDYREAMKLEKVHVQLDGSCCKDQKKRCLACELGGLDIKFCTVQIMSKMAWRMDEPLFKRIAAAPYYSVAQLIGFLK
jgi:hypothetical protein